jgi:hypothetical protein
MLENTGIDTEVSSFSMINRREEQVSELSLVGFGCLHN